MRRTVKPSPDSRRHLRMDESGGEKPPPSAHRPSGEGGLDASPATISFIEYLERKLCRSGPRHLRFTKVGPRSFIFSNQRDTIFVKVSDDNLILVTDGELVVDHVEMHFLPFRNMPAPVSDDDEDLFDHYLQEILHLF
jgi:hypothetical protein